MSENELVVIAFQAPTEMDIQLRVLAARRRISKSALVREILRDWLTAFGQEASAEQLTWAGTSQREEAALVP